MKGLQRFVGAGLVPAPILLRRATISFKSFSILHFQFSIPQVPALFSLGGMMGQPQGLPLQSARAVLK
jgi:hypothetical protein